MTPGTAVKLTGAAIATIYGVQLVLAGAGMLDLAASALANIAVLAGLAWFAHRSGLGANGLGLRRAAPRFIVSALLVGSSAWYLNARLVQLVDPPGDSDVLAVLIAQTPLVPTLLVLSVLPALAEELVFRGVLARALATRLRGGAAIAISSAVFAAYHLLPAQVLSTFGLGLALGFLTLRSGSVVPAMVVHAINNAIAVVISRDELPGVGGWLTAHPNATLAGAGICVACGLGLAGKGAA